MSPEKTKMKANQEFGFLVLKREEMPAITGRGRGAVIPQLTVAKLFREAVSRIAKEGVGISEEVFGVDLTSQATQKEAVKLKLSAKGLGQSFFLYAKSLLKEFDLDKKAELTRRDGGKKIYLIGPAVEESR